MTNELTVNNVKETNGFNIFSNQEFGDLRVTVINGEPWFIGKEVAKVLGYSNTRDALSKRVDEEDKTVAICDSHGGRQKTTIINEAGLYSLIISSKLPSAKKFKRWVLSDVLPSIRKHGGYITEDTTNKMLKDPKEVEKFINTFKEKYEEERKARIESDLKVNKLESTLKAQEPLVNFCKTVANTEGLTDLGTTAKLLNDEGINIGRNKLFQFLRNKKILMNNNLPYQKYINLGFFKVKKTMVISRNGHRPYDTTLVTGTGQIFIADEVRKNIEFVNSI